MPYLQLIETYSEWILEPWAKTIKKQAKLKLIKTGKDVITKDKFSSQELRNLAEHWILWASTRPHYRHRKQSHLSSSIHWPTLLQSSVLGSRSQVKRKPKPWMVGGQSSTTTMGILKTFSTMRNTGSWSKHSKVSHRLRTLKTQFLIGRRLRKKISRLRKRSKTLEAQMNVEKKFFLSKISVSQPAMLAVTSSLHPFAKTCTNARLKESNREVKQRQPLTTSTRILKEQRECFTRTTNSEIAPSPPQVLSTRDLQMSKATAKLCKHRTIGPLKKKVRKILMLIIILKRNEKPQTSQMDSMSSTLLYSNKLIIENAFK